MTRLKNRGLLVALIGGLLFLTCLLVQIPYCQPKQALQGEEALADSVVRQATDRFDRVTFENLDDKSTHNEVLILTLLKPDMIPYLGNYFKTLKRLTYPKDKLSFAVLLINPTPTSTHAIRHRFERARPGAQVKIYTKTFDDDAITFAMAPSQETVYELQPLRQSSLARARNYLVQSALADRHDYVLWLDPRLVSAPPTLIQDLIGVDADIVVPNTLSRHENEEWGHDKRNWQETDLSRTLQDEVPEDFVFMEGKTEKIEK